MPPTPTAHHVPHVTAHPRQLSPTRANLGPLTTPYAFPSHCTRLAISGSNAIRGQTCRAPSTKPTGTAEDDTGCWPRATAYPTAAASASSLGGLGFYSPGVMCPVGYATVCSQLSTSAGAAPKMTGAPVPNFAFQFPLVAGETAVGCCPTGYTCAMQGSAQACHQKVSTSTALDVMTCSGAAVVDVNAFQVPYSTRGGLVQTVDVWAPLVQLNQMLTDISTASTSSGTSAASRLVASSGSTPSVLSGSLTSTSRTISTTSETGRSSLIPSTSGTGSQAGNATISTTAFSSSTSSPSATTSASISSSSSSGANNSGNILISSSSSSSHSPSAPTTSTSSTMAPTSSSSNIIANIIAGLPGSTTAAIPISNTASAIMTSSFPAIHSASATTPTPSATAAPEAGASMTTGAKVGIAFVPVAAAAMLVTFLLYRWHKKGGGTKEVVEEPKYLSQVPPEEEVVLRSPYNEDNDPPPPPPPPSSGRGSQGSTAIVPGGGQPFDYAAALAARRNTQMDRYNGVNPHYVKASGSESGSGVLLNSSNSSYVYSPHDPAVWKADDLTEEVPMHYYGDERDGSHFRDVSLDNDSPVDGASPFRLKRGNTKKQQYGSGASSLSHPYSNSNHGSPSSVCSEWPSTEWSSSGDSVSGRPPSRPKTGTSSVYDRDSRVLSWYDGSTAMPPMPEPAFMDRAVEKDKVKIGMQRSQSFSYPRKPKMDDPEVDEAVKAVASGKITPPPAGVAPVSEQSLPGVTKDGVAF